MEPIIKAEHLKKIYKSGNGTCIAVKDISISVNTGISIAIVGPSGCGKSTLLYMLGGISSPTEGDICIAGKKIANMNRKEKAQIRANVVSYIVQNFALIDDETVMNNLEVPLLYKIPRKTRKERKALIRHTLKQVGLLEKEGELIKNLSGGQQQRIAIARALLQDTQVILADEPTGALNIEMGNEIMELLLSLVKEQGKALVLVTHNEELASMCDKTYRMIDGLFI